MKAPEEFATIANVVPTWRSLEDAQQATDDLAALGVEPFSGARLEPVFTSEIPVALVKEYGKLDTADLDALVWVDPDEQALRALAILDTLLNADLGEALETLRRELHAFEAFRSVDLATLAALAERRVFHHLGATCSTIRLPMPKMGASSNTAPVSWWHVFDRLKDAAGVEYEVRGERLRALEEFGERVRAFEENS